MHKGTVFNARKGWIPAGFYPLFSHRGRLCESGGGNDPRGLSRIQALPVSSKCLLNCKPHASVLVHLQNLPILDLIVIITLIFIE